MTTYFLKTVPSIVDSSLSLSDKLKMTVRNTGNYFFEHGVVNQLKNFEEVTSIYDLPENAEKLVLSMSNFISPNTDLGSLADLLERKKVKQFVMIGAGAQSNSYDDDIKLSAGTLKFIKLLSDKSESIGVRGYYTKNVLESYGIHNSEVIGCPSLFLNNDRNFRIEKKKDSKLDNIAFHYTPTGHYRDSIAYLNDFGLENCSAYIAQSELDLISVVEKNDVKENEIEYMFHYYNSGKYTPMNLRDWFNKNTKWFFDLKSWFSFMSNMDFSLGARFHGNMSAILTGVPALNMVFDTRTREMCQYLNLPHMFLDEFVAGMGKDELFDMADYDIFNRTFATKFDTYVEFLNRNNLKHSLGEVERGEEIAFSSNPRLAGVDRFSKDIEMFAFNESNFDSKILKELFNRQRRDRTLEERKNVEAGMFQKLSPVETNQK